ncbi:hypothetical protein N9Y92_00375 [Chlamydiales bacterium]|nr:hypothetical protein [Chlamydiales bacterium]
MSNTSVEAAIGGAVGGFVSVLTTNALTWVSHRLQLTQGKAEKNIRKFTKKLSYRLERLEYEMDELKKSVFQDALESPNTAFLFEKAIRESAATDCDERHTLLAELIAQRLSAGGEDMIALAGNTACGLINFLSVRQINLLALLAVVYEVRPLQKQITPQDVDQASRLVLNWWEAQLSKILQNFDIKAVSRLDIEHLASLGCLRISIGSKNFKSIISTNILDKDIALSEDLLNSTSWYPSLKSQEDSLSHCSLTTTGILIGILHLDSLNNTKTVINW